MRIIEFTTKIEDGTIKVPKKYLDSLKDKLRVIIFTTNENDTPKKIERKKHFTAFKVETEGLKFDREEANQR